MYLFAVLTVSSLWALISVQPAEPPWFPPLGETGQYEGKRYCQDKYATFGVDVATANHSFIAATINDTVTFPDWKERVTWMHLQIKTMGDAHFYDRSVLIVEGHGPKAYRSSTPLCLRLEDVDKLAQTSGKEKLDLLVLTKASHLRVVDMFEDPFPQLLSFRPGNPFQASILLDQTNTYYRVQAWIFQACPVGRYGYLCQQICQCADRVPCSVDRGICQLPPTAKPKDKDPEDIAWWIFVLIGLAGVCGFFTCIIAVFCIVSKILKKKRAHRSRHHDSRSTEDESKEARSKKRSKKSKKHKRKRRDPTVSEETGGTTEETTGSMERKRRH